MRPYVKPQMLEARRDPETGLWCLENGAVLLPPSGTKFKKFRRAFGSKTGNGYLAVGYQWGLHYVHRMMARAFLPNPGNLPTVDHLDRNTANNRVDNLRWADPRAQANNRQVCEDSKAKYGVRSCEDRSAYDAVRYAEMKAAGFVKRKGPDGKQGWFPRIKPKLKGES